MKVGEEFHYFIFSARTQYEKEWKMWVMDFTPRASSNPTMDIVTLKKTVILEIARLTIRETKRRMGLHVSWVVPFLTDPERRLDLALY